MKDHLIRSSFTAGLNRNSADPATWILTGDCTCAADTRGVVGLCLCCGESRTANHEQHSQCHRFSFHEYPHWWMSADQSFS